MSEVLTLIESYVGLNSFPYTFNAIPTGNEFIIDTANNNTQKQHWVRAGYIQAVSIISGVEMTGKPEFVAFGRQKISLQIPSVPYQIRFNPSSYVENWSIDLYEIDSNLDYFELANLTGLSQSFLKSQSVTSIQLLLGINNMPSGDTRNLATEVNLIKESVTGLTDRVNTQENGTLGYEMIQIGSSDFLPIANGRYLCTKTAKKVKGGDGLQLTLQDADGDYQGLAQLISGVDNIDQNVGVELSAQQFADADYPLYLICQGVKIPSTPSTQGTDLGYGFSVQLASGVLNFYNPSGQVSLTIANVSQARFKVWGVFILLDDGTFVEASSPWDSIVPSTLANWEWVADGVAL